MPFNLLLLPLLGGFLLLHRAFYWRFHLVRFDGHRLIFFSAAAGVGLLVASTLLSWLVSFNLNGSADLWHSVVPFDHSGKAFGALALGAFLPFVMNRIPGARRHERVRNAIAYFNNEMELLLLRSMDTESNVMLTMNSGKVYVGYLTNLFNPDMDRKYIRILPTMSGYRSERTHEVLFTTSYDAVREHAKDPGSPLYHLLDKDFEIVLPVAELRSVSLFDFAAFTYFTSGDGGSEADGPPSDDGVIPSAAPPSDAG